MGVNTGGDLLQFPEEKLQECYGYLDVEHCKRNPWRSMKDFALTWTKTKGWRTLLSLHARAYKSSDSDSQKKFPSKSYPIRYGTAKIQEDAFNLFQAGLREYIGSYGVKTQGSLCSGWGITSFSVLASKIVPIPSGTCLIDKYFHGQSTSHFSSMQPLDNFNAEATVSLPPGSKCYSEVNSPKAEVHFPKESWIEDRVPDLELQEQSKFIER
ncbi:hypothetical protein F3Y22_tig00110505pilonHSYRG00313 [Hibiscus syriacus]|uniref:Uncharacterized protein n=1 Tax=Hibiscus syriacus TaxID=106335 RepID=A0A6A3AD83_HIBSY|nr:hypothetical protein F3Y22_tig00110505pilonHSYRG00313 [Hibiscus syriacus]